MRPGRDKALMALHVCLGFAAPDPSRGESKFGNNRSLRGPFNFSQGFLIQIGILQQQMECIAVI